MDNFFSINNKCDIKVTPICEKKLNHHDTLVNKNKNVLKLLNKIKISPPHSTVPNHKKYKIMFSKYTNKLNQFYNI